MERLCGTGRGVMNREEVWCDCKCDCDCDCCCDCCCGDCCIENCDCCCCCIGNCDCCCMGECANTVELTDTRGGPMEGGPRVTGRVRGRGGGRGKGY